MISEGSDRRRSQLHAIRQEASSFGVKVILVSWKLKGRDKSI
jgi:hypothetical protein